MSKAKWYFLFVCICTTFSAINYLADRTWHAIPFIVIAGSCAIISYIYEERGE